MKFIHHNREFELCDDWWAEAGMVDFVPASIAYHTDDSLAQGNEIRYVLIQDVGPIRRSSLFHHGEELTARERVVNILRGFQSGDAIPPVEIAKDRPGPYRYKLTHGAHRFYCSLAAGFTHVPTIAGFDLELLDPK